jgi:hypothetical protein
LLWPIAWLWAYTSPIGYKMAFGTEKHEDFFIEHGEWAHRGKIEGEHLDHLLGELNAWRDAIASRPNSGGCASACSPHKRAGCRASAHRILANAQGGTRKMRAELNAATSKSGAARAQLDLARKRVEQNRQLVAAGAVDRFALEQAQASVLEMQAQLAASVVGEAQVRAGLSATVDETPRPGPRNGWRYTLRGGRLSTTPSRRPNEPCGLALSPLRDSPEPGHAAQLHQSFKWQEMLKPCQPGVHGVPACATWWRYAQCRPETS